MSASRDALSDLLGQVSGGPTPDDKARAAYHAAIGKPGVPVPPIIDSGRPVPNAAYW